MTQKLYLRIKKELINQKVEFDYSLIFRSYKRIGHIAIINLHEKLFTWRFEIANVLLNILSPSIKTVARFTNPILGKIRSPSVEWLAGDSSFETKHRELQTIFIINPKKIMLSSGNHFERKRLIKLFKISSIKRPIIVDMFACIGNLTLPLAKHNPLVKVIALEINMNAIKYLEKSLLINHISKNRFHVIHGDNRTTCPKNVADFVILGYFGIDSIQIKVAIKALKRDIGGFLIIHDSHLLNFNSQVLNNLIQIIKQQPFWVLTSVKKRRVKTISASRIHSVFDCEIRPAS